MMYTCTLYSLFHFITLFSQLIISPMFDQLPTRLMKLSLLCYVTAVENVLFKVLHFFKQNDTVLFVVKQLIF